MELPDAWTIIVDSENNLLRIFAQYRADGFSAGMHSRLSSGFHLRDVAERENEYLIIQQSGTTYSLRKDDEGVGDPFMRSELNRLLSKNRDFYTTKISLELSCVSKSMLGPDKTKLEDSKADACVSNVHKILNRWGVNECQKLS